MRRGRALVALLAMLLAVQCIPGASQGADKDSQVGAYERMYGFIGSFEAQNTR